MKTKIVVAIASLLFACGPALEGPENEPQVQPPVQQPTPTPDTGNTNPARVDVEVNVTGCATPTTHTPETIPGLGDPCQTHADDHCVGMHRVLKCAPYQAKQIYDCPFCTETSSGPVCQ